MPLKQITFDEMPLEKVSIWAKVTAFFSLNSGWQQFYIFFAKVRDEAKLDSRL